jgi:hypothetical protein
LKEYKNMKYAFENLEVWQKSRKLVNPSTEKKNSE